MTRLPELALTGALLAPALGIAENAAPAASTAPAQACLMRELAAAPPEATVAELRARCAEPPDAPADTLRVGEVDGPTAIDERLAEEQAAIDRGFTLTAHQPNYVIATYSDNVNQAPFADELGMPTPLEKQEVKFQISFKAPVWRNPLDSESNLYFGYTATSWWQLGNTDISNPFRETNYEPELFLRNAKPHRWLGLRVSAYDIGLNHESNGRSGDLSRSWNRVYGRVVLDLNDVALAARAWYRIPESDAKDDNPYMYRYYGYGDLNAVWAPNKNTYSLLYRQGTEGGAVQLTWSRALNRTWRIYAQYWNGYGESLIDYNYRTERIGIGFALSDVLER